MKEELNEVIVKNYIEEFKKVMSTFCKFPYRNTTLGWGRGQIAIMNYLFDHPQGVTPSELASFLQVGSGRIGTALKDLKNKGMVERTQSQKDKRKALIKLSAYGLKEVERRRENHFQMTKYVITNMGEKKFQQFLSLLSEVMKYSAEFHEKKGDNK